MELLCTPSPYADWIKSYCCTFYQKWPLLLHFFAYIQYPLVGDGGDDDGAGSLARLSGVGTPNAGSLSKVPFELPHSHALSTLDSRLPPWLTAHTSQKTNHRAAPSGEFLKRTSDIMTSSIHSIGTWAKGLNMRSVKKGLKA